MIKHARTALACALSTGLLTTTWLTASSHAVTEAAREAAAPGHAAAEPRCTIEGTPHKDRLVGTGKRDVICGLGGNDLLVGAGGDDVLLGGRGRDQLDGGNGADKLDGGAGVDRFDGGDDADRIVGGTGDDTVSGGSGRDFISGGAGDDDLDGGPGPDRVSGGAGTNWCVPDWSDRTSRCKRDTAVPVVDGVAFSAPSVDVSTGPRVVTVRVHATDDTGVQSVHVAPGREARWMPTASAELVSGTVRAGWWEATLELPQWTRPGTYVPEVSAIDRYEQPAVAPVGVATLAVQNSNPDLEPPTADLLGPDASVVHDVRSSAQDITVHVHLTDAYSGVDGQGVSVTLWSPRQGGGAPHQGYSVPLRPQSGTRHDGVWSGTIHLPQGQVGGDWQLAVHARDVAARGSRYGVSYWGPHEYPYQSGIAGDQDVRALPRGMGTVTVLGR